MENHDCTIASARINKIYEDFDELLVIHRNVSKDDHDLAHWEDLYKNTSFLRREHSVALDNYILSHVYEEVSSSCEIYARATTSNDETECLLAQKNRMSIITEEIKKEYFMKLSMF